MHSDRIHACCMIRSTEYQSYNVHLPSWVLVAAKMVSSDMTTVCSPSSAAASTKLLVLIELLLLLTAVVEPWSTSTSAPALTPLLCWMTDPEIDLKFASVVARCALLSSLPIRRLLSLVLYDGEGKQLSFCLKTFSCLDCIASANLRNNLRCIQRMQASKGHRQNAECRCCTIAYTVVKVRGLGGLNPLLPFEPPPLQLYEPPWSNL